MDKQQGETFVAKAPETQDRFRIFAETSIEAMGPLLAQLTRMGLENIGYELITDVASFKSRPNKSYDISGDAFAEKWIADNPTFQVKALVYHFKENGRPGTSAYPAVRNLIDSGKLVKLSPGHYQRSDVKAIAPPNNQKPAKTAKKAKRPANPVARYDIPNRTVIVKAIRNRKRFTVREMEQLFTEEGRNKKSVSPLINRLSVDKIVRQIEPGVYAVNKAAIVKESPPKSSAERNRLFRERKAAMNGQQHPLPPSEEIHG